MAHDLRGKPECVRCDFRGNIEQCNEMRGQPCARHRVDKTSIRYKAAQYIVHRGWWAGYDIGTTVLKEDKYVQLRRYEIMQEKFRNVSWESLWITDAMKVRAEMIYTMRKGARDAKECLCR